MELKSVKESSFCSMDGSHFLNEEGLGSEFFLNDHGLALLKQDNAKALVDVLMEEIATAEAERDSTEASL